MRQFMIVLCLWLHPMGASAQVQLEWAIIGNEGNADDPSTGFGRVDYEYRISAKEVTNAQYAAFLNAVADSDPNGLWSANMSSGLGGISRTGNDGSYEYTPVAGRESEPVIYVSFLDAMRFVNWLQNGQGSGGTEHGTYAVVDGLSESRMSGARYFIPSENEWYKAAFFRPASDDGPAGTYGRYATQSGDELIPGVDGNVEFAVGSLTPAGSYPASVQGIFDMAGNVWEFNEAFLNGGRVLRGGSWNSLVHTCVSSRRADFARPDLELGHVGIRVGSTVPCPGDHPLIAHTAQVDFETILGTNVPTPGQPIGSQYAASTGLAFSLESGGLPIIVQRSNPVGPYGAFASGYAASQNVPAPRQCVGEFFLADPNIVQGTSPEVVIVAMTQPANAVGGVILDVDGIEVFTVSAMASDGSLIADFIVDANDIGAGDGLAAPWQFVRSQPDIASVRIELTSYGAGNPGYALDNFWVSIPESCSADIADDLGNPTPDGMVGFGDFLALLGLVGPCPSDPGCPGDIADDFGTPGPDGMVTFGDFLALLGFVGPCP